MRQCILVLGMHRSGTSALSGMLNLLNVYQGGHLLPSSSANRKGFFENTRILAFNDQVLHEQGSSWDDVFFTDRHLIIDKYSESLKSLIVEEFGDVDCFSIKDPRICLLFPIYEKALTEMGISLHPILIYRNPMETAVSLKHRDGFSSEKGLILWLEHFLLSEKYTRPYPRLLVRFDELLQDPGRLIASIQETWGLNLEIDPNTPEQLRTFLQSDLKHVNISWHHLSQKLPESMHELVRILPSPREIDKYRNILDRIRQVYFREKAFFFLNELRATPKQGDAVRFAQFFTDTGTGFSEDASRRIADPEGQKSIELDLSEFSDIQGIRFDPLNQAVAISIISARFQLENDQWIQAAPRPLNASYFSDEVDYFVHDDPNYLIPIPLTPKSRLQRLVIHTVYHKMGAPDVAPFVCTMLRQLLHRQRNVLVSRILRGERTWKQTCDNERRESRRIIEALTQDLEAKKHEIHNEKQARRASEQKARRLEKDSEQKARRLEKDLDMAKMKTDRLIAENRNIHTELQNVYHSKTWRLTRPVRRIISWFF